MHSFSDDFAWFPRFVSGLGSGYCHRKTASGGRYRRRQHLRHQIPNHKISTSTLLSLRKRPLVCQPLIPSLVWQTLITVQIFQIQQSLPVPSVMLRSSSQISSIQVVGFTPSIEDGVTRMGSYFRLAIREIMWNLSVLHFRFCGNAQDSMLFGVTAI